MLKVIEHLCEYGNFCFSLIAVLQAVRNVPGAVVANFGPYSSMGAGQSIR